MTTTSRLSDTQVDALADALEQFAKPAAEVTYANVPLFADSSRTLGIMRAHDFPWAGLTTACSFGLAHEDWHSENFPDRLELVMAYDQTNLHYERLLVTIASVIMQRQRLPKPGVVYQDAIQAAGLSDLIPLMPHVLVLFPYLWPDAFERIDIEGARVWFLQIVPIYEDEMNFIVENDFATFEELLSCHGVSFEDMQRQSHMSL